MLPQFINWHNNFDANLNSSVISSIDSRLKLILVLVFVIVTASFPPSSFFWALPLILIPYLWLIFANINFKKFFLKILIVSPFVVFVGIFNLFFEQETFVIINNINISKGMISFFTILLKFILSIAVLILYFESDGIFRICTAMNKFAVPKIFTTQVFLLYRYLFLLINIVNNRLLAYNLRANINNSPSHKISIFVSGSMLGSIVLQLLARAENIHQAMLCRGFNGAFPEILNKNTTQIKIKDVIILIILILYILIVKIINIPQLIGTVI